MVDTNEYEVPRTERIPFRYRIRYLFSGYKTQNFFNKVCKKAPVYLLVILLVLSFCYISLHPVNKIKLNYFFTRNCTIRVGTRALTLSSLSDGFFIMSTDNVIRIDGDWIEVVSDDFYNKKSDYYHIENGVIYHYYYKTANGEWIKMIYNSDPEDEKIGSELLDKRNYTRSKENFFVWILNGDIDKQVKGLSDIRVKRVNGSLAIVGTFFVDAIECEESIRFTKFGITKIDAPWEELEKATLYIPPQSK